VEIPCSEKSAVSNFRLRFLNAASKNAKSRVVWIFRKKNVKYIFSNYVDHLPAAVRVTTLQSLSNSPTFPGISNGRINIY